jgi:hypothetical protein
MLECTQGAVGVNGYNDCLQQCRGSDSLAMEEWYLKRATVYGGHTALSCQPPHQECTQCQRGTYLIPGIKAWYELNKAWYQLIKAWYQLNRAWYQGLAFPVIDLVHLSLLFPTF